MSRAVHKSNSRAPTHWLICAQVVSEEGSIKTAERMVEAMKSEIAKKHQAEEGAGWQPVSALVRDALRATVVCPGAQAMCDVKAAFDASPSAQTKALRRVC